MDERQAAELYGRMPEDSDIQMAIESGQFKSLQDVLDAVKGRTEHINKALLDGGMLTPARNAIAYSSGEAAIVKLN